MKLQLLSLILAVVGFIAAVVALAVIRHPSSEPYEPVNIVHLVLYSKDPYYDEMRELTRKHYQKYPFVRTVYYRFDNTLPEPLRYTDDLLLIRGEETYIPGILDKTLVAFEWAERHFRETPYDYLVRSNISTIIDFDVLVAQLNQPSVRPLHYGGGVQHYTDDRSESWIQGTAIVFSKPTFNRLLELKSKIHRAEIDDVAIGRTVREHIPEALPVVELSAHFTIVPNYNGNRERLHQLVRKRFAFYRNRCNQLHNGNENRAMDVQQMRVLLSLLNS